jgi:hypothetical protein
MAKHPNDEKREGRHELYLHRRGEPRVALLDVDTAATVETALGIGDGELVWAEDSDAEIDVSLTVAAAGLRHRGHVHAGRCRKVETEVTHNSDSKQRTFQPSTRIDRVFEWAVSKRGFNLTPTDAAEHELVVSGTSIKPDPSDHVGSFIGDDCAVAFSLVPKIRNEG